MQQLVLTLHEYTPARFPAALLTEPMAEEIDRRYGKYVLIEPPSFRTQQQWQLTAQGWVGFIPLGEHLALSLQPRVLLGNLFRMLEYAYDLKGFLILDGLFACESLPDFYERLALILARRILHRSRQGFYRVYREYTERSAFVRGRLDIAHALAVPWDAQPRCEYQEHTADNEDNQILLWTLDTIVRSGLCSAAALPLLRQTWRILHEIASLQPYTGAECRQRQYHRLNDDYRILHALCAFFLENSGPTPAPGAYQMLPFLVDMPRLFERFVARWLAAYLPTDIALREQEHVKLDSDGQFSFLLDIVLYARATGATRAVIDTKYKVPRQPAEEDVRQIIAYAHLKQCQHAILLYPAPLVQALATTLQGTQIRSLTFALDGDIEAAGRIFLDALLARGEEAGP